MAESIYQQAALQKATEREENRNSGRIPHKERKFWEDTTQRKETIDGGGTLAQSRGKERIMKAWAQKANVAFCTIFFFYQVFPKIIFSFPHDCLDTFYFQYSG